MSAIIRNGEVRKLDLLPEPDEQITPEQVQDVPRMARLLMRILRDLALLKRRWWPRRLDFEDVAVDGAGTTLYRLPHGFGGRVRFWIVDWSGSSAPNLRKDAASDDRTLVLTSTSVGTATVRVEEAG